MRIAFVADTINTSTAGGVVAGHRFVDALRKRHRVTVVGAEAHGDDSVVLPGFTLPVQAMKRMHFEMAHPIRSVLARAFREVDVVHLQFPFWLSLVALDEARRAGRPVVAAFHVQPENALENVGIHWRWLSDLLYREWIAHHYGRADAVVCPSPFAERKLREHGLRAPTFVVSNGVPPDVAPRAVEREPAHRGRFLVMMVGRLAAEKHQEVLLEAVRASRHAERISVVVAGSGPREEELRALAQGLPGGAEVGFLPRERLLDLLAAADLFVHCGAIELEGIAVLESLAMALPPLVAEGPETAAADLAPGPRFRFPAGDVRALTERVDDLIEHPEVLAAARARCLDLARAYDFHACVSRLEDVYRSVLTTARAERVSQL